MNERKVICSCFVMRKSEIERRLFGRVQRVPIIGDVYKKEEAIYKIIDIITAQNGKKIAICKVFNNNKTSIKGITINELSKIKDKDRVYKLIHCGDFFNCDNDDYKECLWWCRIK